MVSVTQTQRRQRLFWTLIGIISCTFWGISGLCAKGLFNISPEVTPMWVSQVRMITAGIILILVAAATHKDPLRVWRSKRDAITITAYGVLGLLPVQYCYFRVVQEGNASIATILQFIGPFFIVAYVALFRHQRPRRIEMIAAVVAFLGVFTLATHGHFNHLALTPGILFWGLCSAVGVATNTLIPQRMVRGGFSSLVITGWGLLISGLALLLVHPAQPKLPHGNMIWLLLAGVIVIGTLIPFQLFTNALRYIPPSTAGFLDAFEPLSATIGSVLIFNLHLTGADWIGSIMIIVAVLALSYQPKAKRVSTE